MEFGEKLQKLRKGRGMTQEELADALYVSRTAVSKWESGRGYPNIDSLKEISRFFSVSIDDLLSGEKLISIAERENKSNVRHVCDLLFGMTDLFSLILIILPLYPKTINGFVYSVSLLMYTETTELNRTVYWVLFLALVMCGILEVTMSLRKQETKTNILTGSMVFSVVTVVVLALGAETYAVTIVFLLLVVKAALRFKCANIQ